MSLFNFFHNDEKKELISSVNKRKNNLLKQVNGLFLEGKRFKKILDLENHILESVRRLDINVSEEIKNVLDENKTEEEILDYLANLEKEILILIENDDVELIKINLVKYIRILEQLKVKLENLELTKKAQLNRIKEEEEKLKAEAEKKAFEDNVEEIEKKKKALELMKQALKVESKENKISRKRFYRSITDLTKNSAQLVSELLEITVSVAKIGASTSSAVAKKVSDKLK